jgi:hypothetical protein
VTAYVLALVPTLVVLLGLLLTLAPEMFATAFDSLGAIAGRLSDAIERGRIAVAALTVLQALTLVLPCAAITLSLLRIGKRSGGALVRRAGLKQPGEAAA